MLDELAAQLKSAGNSIAKLQEVLENYIRYRRELKDKIARYDNDLDYELANLEIRAEERTRQTGTEILIENAILAIENTKEFDLPEFKQRLVNAIRDSRTITIQHDNSNPIVRINLEVTAGTLEDYFAGVEAARANLGIGSTRTPKRRTHKESGDDLPSRIWRDKIYSSAREGGIKNPKSDKERGNVAKFASQYYRTIEARLAAMNSMAPWWYILEYGTPDSSGTGFPYPVFSGQGFVANSIPLIKSAYLRILDSMHSNIFETYSKLVRNVQEIIESVDTEIEKIKLLLEALVGLDIKSDMDIAIGVIEERLMELGHSLDDADPKKVVELAYRFTEGTYAGTVGEKVTLGVGIRLRTIELRQIFEDALAERIAN